MGLFSKEGTFKVLFFGSLMYFAVEHLKDSESTVAILIILFILII